MTEIARKHYQRSHGFELVITFIPDRMAANSFSVTRDLLICFYLPSLFYFCLSHASHITSGCCVSPDPTILSLFSDPQ